ncbi:MAG: hypothetical protein ACF8XB_08015 [Planctomycetota bacterium JB042]
MNVRTRIAVACVALLGMAAPGGPALGEEPPPQNGPCRQCVPVVIGGDPTWLCPDGFNEGATSCRIDETCVEIGGC